MVDDRIEDASRPARAAGSPIIFFDGVCNLCNAAVQWVVAHDRRNAFSFASLQSRAAESVLHDAQAHQMLPDSIVLVDARGVHTKSDAAIRIARRIGFPWSLAAAFVLVPRPLRDGLYALVARNRYRWFGRRESCMVPTPEQRSRWLDADELPASSATGTRAPEAAPSTADAPGLAWTLALRFALAYFVIYLFPFPLRTLVLTGWLAAPYLAFMHRLVPWLGQLFFGVTVEHAYNGSGDRTYNYVEHFTYVLLALLVTIAWTVWRRRRPVSSRVLHGVTTYVRYGLAAIMLSYGWSKVFPVQFPEPGPDRLLSTYGDSSPMGLLWTFMGASKAYVVFAGLGEVVSGLLLLWRRTALLGAVVCAGVMMNVVALNFCYDVPVKLYSSHLLLMSFFLIAPHAARLLSVLYINLPTVPIAMQSERLRPAWLHLSAIGVRWLLVISITIVPALQSYRRLVTQGSLAPKKPWHGVYRVESFTRDGITDGALPDAARWVRLGIASYGAGTIQRADGTLLRQRMVVDEAKHTLTITRRSEPDTLVLSFQQPAPNEILLEGPFEGGTIAARLLRHDADKPLLTSRGFRWINEFPFNR